MANIVREQLILNQHIPIEIGKLKTILYQMENCICKIYKDNTIGTGFFCKLPYNNTKLPVLITNNHILNKNDIKDNQVIKIAINNIGKQIKLDNSRIKYTNEELDITIIEIETNKDEIFDNKNINNFMDIDEEAIYAIKNNVEEYKISQYI